MVTTTNTSTLLYFTPTSSSVSLLPLSDNYTQITFTNQTAYHDLDTSDMKVILDHVVLVKSSIAPFVLVFGIVSNLLTLLTLRQPKLKVGNSSSLFIFKECPI